jgi:hypothetical protein
MRCIFISIYACLWADVEKDMNRNFRVKNAYGHCKLSTIYEITRGNVICAVDLVIFR